MIFWKVKNQVEKNTFLFNITKAITKLFKVVLMNHREFFFATTQRVYCESNFIAVFI